jgi:hypothetical protein
MFIISGAQVIINQTYFARNICDITYATAFDKSNSQANK